MERLSVTPDTARLLWYLQASEGRRFTLQPFSTIKHCSMIPNNPLWPSVDLINNDKDDFDGYKET